MFNLGKHIAYWRDGAQEDYEVAKELVEKGRFQHALFLCHLSVEKMLKAHVTRVEQDVPPKIHNLVSLAQMTQLTIDLDMMQFLRRLNPYQLLGRYADQSGAAALSREHTREMMHGAREILEWLNEKL